MSIKHYSADVQLNSLIEIFTVNHSCLNKYTTGCQSRVFGVDFKMWLRLSDWLVGFWHVKPSDSHNLKLAGCLWRQCTLSLVARHPPYKGWREKSDAMLSWCLTERALPPGGNETRGGLVPVDLHVWEALCFKAKLPDYSALRGVYEWRIK